MSLRERFSETKASLRNRMSETKTSLYDRISETKVSFDKWIGIFYKPAEKLAPLFLGSEAIVMGPTSTSQVNAGISTEEFQHPLERPDSTGQINSGQVGVKVAIPTVHADTPKQSHALVDVSNDSQSSINDNEVAVIEEQSLPVSAYNRSSVSPPTFPPLPSVPSNVSLLTEHSLAHHFASAQSPPMAPQFQSPDSSDSPHLSLTYNTGHVENNTKSSTLNLTGNNNNIQVGGVDKGTEALKLIAQYSNPDAELTAGARYPPPRCYPRTREKLLSAALRWIEDLKREKQVYWLHGAAGVGKSAFAQTLAERAKEKGMLGGTFFFSRPNNRNDPNTVFPTIAHRLAVTNKVYKEEVGRVVVADIQLLKADFTVQFEELIVKPLHQVETTDKLLIVLDGLDECKGKENQCKIAELVMQAVQSRSESPLPVIWVICSRPERHLKRILDRKDVQELCWIEELHVNSSEAQADAERYIRSEFERIQEKFEDVVDEEWPGEEKLLRLIKASSGLFAFSSTLLRFIDDEKCADPERQLNIVMRTLDESFGKDNTKSLRNPLDILYNLYMGILEEIPPDIIDDTLLLLHSYRWLQKKKLLPSTAQYFANVIGLNKGRFYSVVGNLRSVLQVDKESSDNAGLTFYHASFSDFLLDPLAGRFCYDDQQIRSALRQRVIKVMNSDALLTLVFQSMTIQPTISIDLSIFPWPCKDNDTARISVDTIFGAFFQLATEQDMKQVDFRKFTYSGFDVSTGLRANIFSKGRSWEDLERKFRKLEKDIPNLRQRLNLCDDNWSYESPSGWCWSATDTFHIRLLQRMMKSINNYQSGDIFVNVRVFLGSTHADDGNIWDIVFLGYAERSIICTRRQSAYGDTANFFSLHHNLSTVWPQYPELNHYSPVYSWHSMSNDVVQLRHR